MKKKKQLQDLIINYDRAYNKYLKEKNIEVVCPYCHAISNLYNLNHHLRSKNCQKIKNIILIDKPTYENEFILKLNKIKKDYKYNLKNHEVTIDDLNINEL